MTSTLARRAARTGRHGTLCQEALDARHRSPGAVAEGVASVPILKFA